MKAVTSRPSPSLVETCLPVASYLFYKPQLSSNVVETRLALVVDAHRPCQRPLDGRLRPGGVPLREGVGKGDACCREIGQAADEADPAVRTLRATYCRGEITLTASQELTCNAGA
jgi:hypothetical protein